VKSTKLFHRGIGIVLSALLCSAAWAQNDASPPPELSPAQSNRLLETWRGFMKRAVLPKEGCFTANYPSLEWQEMACVTVPLRPHPPALPPQPNVVGNGVDYSASVSNVISAVEGSFDSVSGVTSEYDSGLGSPNTFSLQINTNLFPTGPLSICGNSPNNCLGWQQFIYDSAPAAGGVNILTGVAYIQYWMMYYNTQSPGSCTSARQCPQQNTCCPGGNCCPDDWCPYTYNPKNVACFKNSQGNGFYPAPFIAKLQQMSLTAEAKYPGNDTVTFSIGSTMYRIQAADSTLNLAPFWEQAEFNIFGVANSSQAIFNPGSTIVVRSSVTNGAGAPPTCANRGFTGETNNLSLVSCAQTGSPPGISFTESNVPGAGPATRAPETTSSPSVSSGQK